MEDEELERWKADAACGYCGHPTSDCDCRPCDTCGRLLDDEVQDAYRRRRAVCVECLEIEEEEALQDEASVDEEDEPLLEASDILEKIESAGRGYADLLELYDDAVRFIDQLRERGAIDEAEEGGEGIPAPDSTTTIRRWVAAKVHAQVIQHQEVGSGGEVLEQYFYWESLPSGPARSRKFSTWQEACDAMVTARKGPVEG